jgi:hypothetical protein
MVGELGYSVMPVMFWVVAQETVSIIVPSIPWYSAVMVVVPQPVAVARPVELMVAIATLLDAQVALSVRSSLAVGGVNVPRARNCVVCPICGMVGAAGYSVITVSPPVPPVVTVRLAVPTTGPNDELMVAVMDAVPLPTALAKPEELTVATSVLLDAHVTSAVTFWFVGGCPLRV